MATTCDAGALHGRIQASIKPRPPAGAPMRPFGPGRRCRWIVRQPAAICMPPLRGITARTKRPHVLMANGRVARARKTDRVSGCAAARGAHRAGRTIRSERNIASSRRQRQGATTVRMTYTRALWQRGSRLRRLHRAPATLPASQPGNYRHHPGSIGPSGSLIHKGVAWISSREQWWRATRRTARRC